MKNINQKNFLFLILGYVFLILMLSLSVLIFIHNGKPVDWITQDPATSQRFNPYMGFISNLGIIFWAFTAAICLFSAIVSRGYKNNKLFLFLLFSGLISLFLLLDDLFMFHEVLFPIYLNIREKTTFAMEGLAVLVYLVLFRKQILSSNYKIIILSLILFCFSIFEDIFLNNLSQFLEDAWKFLGIYTWFYFWVITCYDLVIKSRINMEIESNVLTSH